ncbi:MAG: metal ABC transporter ATP-binding protein [Myxococcales bacterium]|nr:metal ABC transporter ATP-binding protein [Myxococcales bacterium]
MTDGTAISIRGLTVQYGPLVALKDVDLDLRSGRLSGVLGPNGAGKSSLMKAIAGEVRPQAGVIRVFGETGSAALRHMAQVAQRSAVDWDFPITVRGVVEQGRYATLGLFGRMRAADHAAVDTALARAGLTELANRRISELSGGQQQRTFVARALAREARLVLLDEPFAGVDAASERVLMDVLQELVRDGVTVVVVHHDLHTAAHYFDELVLIKGGVVAQGAPDVVLQPDTLSRAYGSSLFVMQDARRSGQ